MIFHITICHLFSRLLGPRPSRTEPAFNSVGLDHQCQTGLDLTSLETDVQWYFEHGLAATTRKTYQAGIKKFNNFCSTYNIANPLPVSQSLLCSYITYLAKSGLAYSSIKTYLSAVRYFQVSYGLAAPDRVAMPKLSLVERGIRRAKAVEHKSVCLLITPAILRQLRYHLIAWA